MKLYKIKLKTSPALLFEFVRFSEKNKISTYLSWAEEDMFDPVMFAIISVPAESVTVFEGKYQKQIITKEDF